MLTVKIREDQTGPGEGGFKRTKSCGCIMSKVCDTLGLPRSAQQPRRIGELQAKLLSHGAPKSIITFDNLVGRVQFKQDRAWRALQSGSVLAAQRYMRQALRAALKLGIEVKWLRAKNPVEIPPREMEVF